MRIGTACAARRMDRNGSIAGTVCYEPSARPPLVPADLLLPPISGGAGGNEVVLTSEDGGRFRAYVANAEGADTGVVIAPDNRGLTAFYEELVERFAGAGISALAFDYYGRTAGVERRPDDFDQQPHGARNTTAQQSADLATSIGHLRGSSGARSVFVMGFCKGGRIAFNAAAEHSGLAGVIGFYGWPARRSDNDPSAPIDQVDRMHIPVLGLFGGADKGIPESAAQEFDRALDEHMVRHFIHVYPGLPHGFFDRFQAQHKTENDEAWRRVIGFMRTGDPTAVA
jgi:carboxymethylenebutenolidase